MNRAQRNLIAIEIAEEAVRQARINFRCPGELTEYDVEKIDDELNNITRYLSQRAHRIRWGEREREQRKMRPKANQE